MRIAHVLVTLGIVFGMTAVSLARPQVITQVKSRPVRANVEGIAQLQNELNAIVNSDGTAAIGVYVRSMRTNENLYTRNINQPLTPASTLKILTAESALIYLGPDYRFPTKLLTDAKGVKEGILQGNLYVVLSGDPTLTYNDIEDLLLSLKNQQIHGIAGNIYIDHTAYDQNFYGPGWEWKDKNYCYAAPIGASIINHNCIPFKISPSAAGQMAQVITSPKYFYPAIKNDVITKARSGCHLRVDTDEDSSILLDGCMRPGRYSWGISYVVADIPEYSRSLIKGVLQEQGINLTGRVLLGSTPANTSLVGIHQSKALRALVTEMLKKSDNIIAGALFKKLGQLYFHRQGSWESGSLAVSHILARNAGMNVTGLRALDGSGLSPANLTTPQQMMDVLNYAYHSYGTSFEFISALPIAGIDGTLKHRLYNIARRVRAKTGTIAGVNTLAGYAVSAENEPLAFVIMINGTKGLGWRYKGLEDKIAVALTRFRRA